LKKKRIKISYSRILKNAAKISKQFQDQSERPLERAVWWTEFILRNPNATHLRSPTLDLGNFTSNSYDILVFIFSIVTLTGFLIWKIFQKIFWSKKIVTALKKDD
jgi:hypothetical protein